MASASELREKLQYPKVWRDESVVDDYHGVKIKDPYRWLEDAPDSEMVKEFIQNQMKLTESVLEKCETTAKLHQKLTTLIDRPRYYSLSKRGNKYFYLHNTGLQAHSVLYMQDDLDAEPEVLLDPNTLSDDGTVSVNIFSISENAKYLAYGLSSNGSDWVTIKVMEIEDKKVFKTDTISSVKFSEITWTHDTKGFFYCRYPAPKEGENIFGMNQSQELYYHFLGTDQSKDILCWKDQKIDAKITHDGKYLLIYIEEDSYKDDKLFYYDLSLLPRDLELKGNEDHLLLTELFDILNDTVYNLISNDETSFTFLTNKDAPNYKLARVDIKKPNIWIDVVEEHKKDVLTSACVVNTNQLVTCYMSDVKHVLQIRDLKSGSFLQQVPTMDIGSVSDVSARREDTIFFFSLSSFLTPNVVHMCDLANKRIEIKVFREVIVPGFDKEAFQTTQVFYHSKDGTKIPMFIVAKKDIKLDGSNPCLLYGYGGFNKIIRPSFNVSRVVLSKHLGVVFCVANIRGGGEYGVKWHHAGSLENKQNCFDDFIYGSEYLVSAGYTQPSKLCIEGGSNGGLLIAACINQRPDLFGCALAHVGVMDMLRFHKFTMGHFWTPEYGCSENKEEFLRLIKYSPLHNVKKPWENQTDQRVQYPATMLLTADHDNRVVPLHTFKLLATMQHVLCTSLENSPQKNPIIGRVEAKAGHGGGRPTQKMIDEAADRYSFMAKMVNASWTD